MAKKKVLTKREEREEKLKRLEAELMKQIPAVQKRIAERSHLFKKFKTKKR